MMMKNITIAGAFLVLAGFGPGRLSLDARPETRSPLNAGTLIEKNPPARRGFFV